MCLNNNVCDLTLLAKRSSIEENIIGIFTESGAVHAAAGLNWGYSSGSPRLEDAYIPVNTSNIRSCPNLFIKNSPIKIVWDDGTRMTILAEQNSIGIGDGNLYGKALSTYEDKSQLGNYLRHRIGIQIGRNLNFSEYAIKTIADIKSRNKKDKESIREEIRSNPILLQELRDKFITLDNLVEYGRTNISVRLLDNGTYFFDFSV